MAQRISSEKPALDEHFEETSLSDDTRITNFTAEEQKAIVRRVDRRLVLTLGFLYCISLLDRTNLGNAAIAGLTKELHMNAKNNAYTIISLVFFIPYALFQPPATVLIRKIGPRRFLSVIVLCWGAVMIGFGFCHSWQTMAVLRVILGILEAGFYPGCVYLLSTWYPRFELQKRNAVFYLIGSCASALGGILAYGLMQLSGRAGLSGWRWIFIIEGVLTCVLGIFSYFAIVDFPEISPKSWHFLSQKEADFIVARIEHDRHDVKVEPFSLGTYLRNGLDSKVWGFSALYMCTTTNSYAIAYFLPIILLDGMGFSIAEAQCLVAPPYAAAAVVMYIQAYFGDKWRLRGPIIAGNAALGIVGLGLLGYTHNNGVRYFGVFLATIASNANCPALLTYNSNNVRGQWKRALTSATLVGGGAIGGIIGTSVFRDKDSPKYRPGILACMLANALIILIVAALSLKFWRANKRAANGGKVIEKQPEALILRLKTELPAKLFNWGGWLIDEPERIMRCVLSTGSNYTPLPLLLSLKGGYTNYLRRHPMGHNKQTRPAPPRPAQPKPRYPKTLLERVSCHGPPFAFQRFRYSTLETDPEARALRILQWILCSLRSQFYVGAGDKTGLKKPLNAFLDEIFEGRWTDNTSTSRIISEQVSHHPPITACYMWDDEHQIRGEGYARVEMNFSGNLNIKQTGHAIVHLDKYDEHYLIPMPNCKVRGFLSANLYPELYGTYYITSSTGFISEITYSGKGFFSGVRNSFEAKLYKVDDTKKEPLYRVRGQWNDKFVITDTRGVKYPITCTLGKIPAAKLQIASLESQDSWETRKAWQHVLAALRDNDMQGIIKEKTKVEEAQRAMRKEEARFGSQSSSLLLKTACSFTSSQQARRINWQQTARKVCGHLTQRKQSWL
ncbi:hypothetical protein B7494_g7037 [Chlorociboria aeruginascens]|nr:hypothetical protein B7494_g7037 [Chlorociboria aeruginascens]